MNGSMLSVIGEVAFYTAVAVLLIIFFLKKKKQINSIKEHQQTDNPNQP
jgi:hypothetical protein